MKRSFCSLLTTILIVATMATIPGHGQPGQTVVRPAIPKTWDDNAMASLEVPLAEVSASPKFPPADYYYRIPVRPIYKSYPVYVPGREPAGYIDWLKQQEPVIVWDNAGHTPSLKTEADWIEAGEIVFDAPRFFDADLTVVEARDPAWYQKTGAPVSKDGTLPFLQYIVRKKGVIEVGQGSCATCHTRVMLDGRIIKGAQGNFSPQRMFAYRVRRDAARAKDKQQYLAFLRNFEKQAHYSPVTLRSDPEWQIDNMSIDEIATITEAFLPGVATRERGSAFYGIQVPDLIGVRDRQYLDHTGLQQHHSIVDMMRYAALNQGAQRLASYGGFIPVDVPRFQKLPDLDKELPGYLIPRYRDEQLYALVLYLYSLQPPDNPNRFDAVAARGQKVFNREGCVGCHTPPLYTNNKLTPAEGFTIPEDHKRKYDILPVSVGTDPNLTLKTRRGTGYYKVPSLKGLWYRGMFPHDGSCATLEDWFDPRRLQHDYVPTGFKGYGIQTRAVKGHEFGLKLSVDDKRALIAFLKTL
jgi:hypothetical protein